MSSEDATSPETPEAKRLTFPPIEIDPDEDPRELNRKLASALLAINENLTYLRLAAERRGHEDAAHRIAIALLEQRMARAEQRIDMIERGEST